jgi:hypothetical protein
MRLLSMYPKKRCTCIACPIAADIARFLPGPRRASLWGPITLLRERLPLRIKTVHRPDHGWLPHLRGPMPTSSEAGHKHNVASEQLHPRTIFFRIDADMCSWLVLVPKATRLERTPLLRARPATLIPTWDFLDLSSGRNSAFMASSILTTVYKLSLVMTRRF